MGMFDYIMGTCPKCNEQIDDQFKSGPCRMLTYNFDEPMSIENAASVDGLRIRCDKCDTEFELDAGFPVDKIKLKLKPTE